jgi:hypothetical protein
MRPYRGVQTDNIPAFTVIVHAIVELSVSTLVAFFAA